MSLRKVRLYCPYSLRHYNNKKRILGGSRYWTANPVPTTLLANDLSTAPSRPVMATPPLVDIKLYLSARQLGYP